MVLADTHPVGDMSAGSPNPAEAVFTRGKHFLPGQPGSPGELRVSWNRKPTWEGT
jgi:hypothetical protein